MKQQLTLIVTAAVIGLAPFTIGATERTGSKATSAKSKPAAVKPAPAKPVAARPAPAAPTPTAETGPRGDTAVHGFFQGWANGMNRGASAIGLDKDPLAGKLPGGNSASRRAAEGPFDTDTTR